MLGKNKLFESSVFGPVPSRRLGISLGVDLVPAKVCTLDCIYCEAGRTNLQTVQRKEYKDISKVIMELGEVLSSKLHLDYVTFSGAGEPTLNSGIGRVVRFIKEKHPEYKVCLITNGTLLGDDQVIRDIEGIDLVIPSLDAADEETYRKINRPCEKMTCENLIDGLVKFRKTSKTLFWLEIFVVPGLNDEEISISAIRKAVERIMPDKIQLNSLDRPGTEKTVEKADMASLKKIQDYLSDITTVEIVGKFAPAKTPAVSGTGTEIGAKILDMISRRPCTVSDLAEAFGRPQQEILDAVSQLVRENEAVAEEMARGIFYKLKHHVVQSLAELPAARSDC